ncbi:MAG: hypothetical protein R3195_09230 [Gemmatimonadota bacterium]|nr:hypothetical protein [Gemmatimonadota bacterium]
MSSPALSPPTRPHTGVIAAGVLTLATVYVFPAAAQEVDDAEWGAPRTLGLVERAIEARSHAFADTTLERFEATAQGHIYFLGDFRGEREVVRADQVALEVRWQAPDNAVQTIVGRRHEVRLPTKIQYHIDHLSLVLDNLGDRIELGEGDEVLGVPHPASPGGPHVYEYRLADSLEIRILDRTARVYRLEVRPRDDDRPAVVGSMYVDRETGAIARLRITFTAASYRDPELESIALDLRSGLWQGRYWLPAEQDVEITRSLRWLSFPLESVIRTRLVVQDYDFDPAESWTLPAGKRVATLPESRLAAFRWWESKLYDGPLDAGDRSDDELSRAVEDARSLVTPWSLERDQRLQFSVPDASSGLRLRRAEGALIGGGLRLRLDAASDLTAWAGYATGAEELEATVGLDRRFGSWRIGLAGRRRSLEDVGWFEPASGVGRSIGLVFDHEDYSDPFFEDGARLAGGVDLGAANIEVGLSYARQRSAELVVESVFTAGGPLRPVRTIDDGELVSLDALVDVRLGARLGTRWSVELEGEAATASIGDFGYTRGAVTLSARRDLLDDPWGWTSLVTLGVSGGSLPAQRLFLLGGRGTLPGFPFRPWGGGRVALWRGDVSRSVVWPWVSVRVTGAAGWADSGPAGASAAERFGVIDTDAVAGSLGVGLGLLYDLVRVELARGIGGGDAPDSVEGDWTFFLTINPRFWDVL